MTPSRLQYLLEQYLNGTATAAELAEYNHWYEQQKNDGEPAFNAAERKEMYRVIAGNIKGKSAVISLRWAAAAVILLLAGALWLFKTTPSPARKTMDKLVAANTDSTVIHNATQQPKTLRLPDGSEVVLYKDATIRYATPFGENSRLILLEGKGFFNVTKNAPLPFTVVSNGVATTALGTSFTITTVRREVKVVLHTGKVMVKAHDQTRYLQPGQQLVCNTLTGTASLVAAVTKTMPAPPAIAFGSLRGVAATFDQVPLSAVLDTIAGKYHVNITGNNTAFNDIAFSGVIRDTDSLSQVLHRMAMLHDLKIISTRTGYRIEKNH
ncbi:MAG: FecR domain-containing protein [Chitinophaga sp.]|uniref:FecR family protein n=1 Tax=Chitinophaga sp. TaxID=1869181 RepID=UPI001B294FC5|nr:FecR domain-containing protein [Chitinophaga sp.]MBO9727750.1 FecR domain-containing protein [Chitinophaga sp.]